MTYRWPKDPRKRWEWCPKCEAWYEITMDEYARLPIYPAGDCVHDDSELRLTQEQVEYASRPAAVIEDAFVGKDVLQSLLDDQPG